MPARQTRPQTPAITGEFLVLDVAASRVHKPGELEIVFGLSV